MSEPKQMYQCTLVRPADTGPGVKVMTAWIEAKGAKVGAEVELLPSGEFWKVKAVWNVMPADMLREHQQMHRKSLPSVIGND